MLDKESSEEPSEEEPQEQEPSGQEQKRKTTLEVRRWAEGRMKGVESLSLSDFTREALAHFQDDKDFVKAFFQQHFYTIMYDHIQRAVASTRPNLLRVGDDMVPSDQFTSGPVPNVFKAWWERVNGRYIKLWVDGTKEDLIWVAIEAKRQMEPLAAKAVLCETVAATMKDGERVSDRYTIEELEAIRARLQLPDFFKLD